MLGSRAFSNDSIFYAEHSHSDPEPLRILSQENIHGKIRALQVRQTTHSKHSYYIGRTGSLLPFH
uniref:Uncharacterized protein n=1 Tax=Sinocyclocheilus grahami TaxID=75366 RepID=A0A672SHJ8_SINGR